MSTSSTGFAVLLGSPVAHSVSPAIHSAAFAAAGLDAVYLACPIDAAGFRSAVDGLHALGALGANVTIPYKVAALTAANEASDEARAVGAANTLVRIEGGWRAENTDVEGFLAGLRTVTTARHRAAVVLGAGGAARAVVYALCTNGAAETVVIAARRLDAANALRDAAQAWAVETAVQVRRYDEAPVRTASLVVNTTPVGTDEADATPWPHAADFHDGQTVYDLVYRPAVTRLLREAAERGATTIGGLPMLVAQAAASFRLWTGRDMDTDVATEAARHALGLLDPDLRESTR